jgi:hypothetical protein
VLENLYLLKQQPDLLVSEKILLSEMILSNGTRSLPQNYRFSMTFNIQQLQIRTSVHLKGAVRDDKSIEVVFWIAPNWLHPVIPPKP